MQHKGKTFSGIWILLAAVLSLGTTGCEVMNTETGIAGTWTASVYFLQVTYAWNDDGTFRMESSAGEDRNGTWTATDSEIHMVFSDGDTLVWQYLLQEGGQRMTVTSTTSTMEVTFLRK